MPVFALTVTTTSTTRPFHKPKPERRQTYKQHLVLSIHLFMNNSFLTYAVYETVNTPKSVQPLVYREGNFAACARRGPRYIP